MAEGGKIYVAGEHGSPLPSVTARPVCIDEIRATYNRNNLFEDPDFPPTLSSIGNVGGDIAAQIGRTQANLFSWQRPHDICAAVGVEEPEFAVTQDSILDKSKLSENDVAQGIIGDCWYVAALQALIKKPELLRIVIPEDNYTGFDDDAYCGAFHFRFYVVADAKWIDIVVDDNLPVIRSGLVAFAQVRTKLNPNHAEFWVALVEKAYAKLHGSYKGIEMGIASQALENFCGGFSQFIFLKSPSTHGLVGDAMIDAIQNPQAAIADTIFTSLDGDAFLALGSYGPGNPGYNTDGYQKYGLIGPHIYTILDAQLVKLKSPPPSLPDAKLMIMKIRNPHGTHEWTGPFSDNDDQSWALLEEDLRRRDAVGSTNIDDGKFWMDLKDVIQYFNTLQICNYNRADGTKLAMVKGIWGPELQNLNEPPSMDELCEYMTYKFEVQRGPLVAEHGDQMAGLGVLALTLVLDGYNCTYDATPIFFAKVYKMESKDEKLVDILQRDPIIKEQSQAREASAWTLVPPGFYLILPQLYNGKLQGKPTYPPVLKGKKLVYAIRIFTENATTLEPVSKSLDDLMDQVRALELQTA